jgi:hypothetical protein
MAPRIGLSRCCTGERHHLTAKCLKASAYGTLNAVPRFPLITFRKLGNRRPPFVTLPVCLNTSSSSEPVSAVSSL